MTNTHPFLGDDFLLTTDIARSLFHGTAVHQPIVDVHNHLPPAEVADDHQWSTITEVWLDGDHYKWRAMRQAGHSEELITGGGDARDRFRAWADTLPRLIGNPLYVWTHLELKRAFGIDEALNPANADEIFDRANAQLADRTALTMLDKFGVRLLATTDDPGDDLAVHLDAQARGLPVHLVPTFRPDKAHALLNDPDAWNTWIDRLAAAESTAITGLSSLLAALSSSYRRFAAAGSRASDHGVAYIPSASADPKRADAIVRAAREGRAASAAERDLVLLEVIANTARDAAANDSVLQLHLGPIRNASPRLFEAAGPDAGADIMNDAAQIDGLVNLLGSLEATGELPRTILYNLNPMHNTALVTLAGAFSRPGVRSLVQWGPPWWFNDHEQGMRRQLDELANVGMLSTFVGMLTDSRSVLSMTRHELFRRVLCAKIGEDVAAGRFPADEEWLAVVVRDVCVANTVDFFGFDSALAEIGQA